MEFGFNETVLVLSCMNFKQFPNSVMHDNFNSLRTVIKSIIRSVITNRSTVACLRVRIIGPFLPSDGKTSLRSLEIEAIFEDRHINLRSITRDVSAFSGCGWAFGRVRALQIRELQTEAKDKYSGDR